MPAKPRRTAHRRPLVTPERLEGRVLFAVDYLLNGNLLTVTTNGTAAAPVNVSTAAYAITGDAAANRITIENYPGTVTVNGTGGGDLVTVYAGSGGTVTVHDAAPTPANPTQVVVRAPAAVRADVTVTPTVASAVNVTVGTDTVTYDNTAGSVSLLGQLFTGGDNLTVNATPATDQTTVGGASIGLGTSPTIYYSTFNALTVNGNGGDDTFTVNNTTVPTTLIAGAGHVSFTVNSNTAPLALVGGTAGSDAAIVNSNSGPLTVTGGAAPVSVTLGASSAATTVNAGSSTTVVNVNGNSALLTVNGGGTATTLNVAGNSGTINANGGTGTDAFTVSATTGVVNVRGGAGPTAYAVPVPTLAPVNITGGTGTGLLTFGGTPQADNFNLTANTLAAGTGATVTYSHLTGVVVAGGTGADTYLVNGDATPTTLVGGSGTDVYNVLADTARVTVTSGTGPSTINVGSNAPSRANDTLAPIAGGVTVAGNGADVVNLLDAADAAARTPTLSAAALSGLTAAPVNYANVATLNVALGSGGNTVVVTGSSATVTNLTLGTGVNAVTVTPAGVAAPLNLTGSGADSLVVDDTATATPKAAAVTAAAVTGLGAGPVNYAGMTSLAVRLGTGGTQLTVAQTNATTPTTVAGGNGPDAITVVANASPTAITTAAAPTTVAIRSIAATTTLAAGGHTAVTVASAANTTATVAAALTVNGVGTDTLTVNDAGDLLPGTATITAAAVTGLGTANGISYAGLAQLNVNLGTVANSATISDTAAATTTNLTGGAAADTVAVPAVSGPTTVNVAGGTDAVTVGPALSAIAAPLTVTGNGATTVLFDDTATATPAVGTLTAATLTGLTAAPVTYAAAATVELRLGTGTDALAIQSTAAPTRVRATAPTAIAVGSTSPAPGGTLSNLNGPLTIAGGNATALALDDTAATAARTASITATTVAGFSPAPITYAGLTQLAVAAGSGVDAIAVRSTAVPTTVLAGTGTDAITIGNGGSVDAVAAPVTVDGHALAALTVDDAANPAGKSPAVSATTVTDLAPATITYAHVATLSVLAGTGGDDVTVTGTTAPTTVDAGGGTNAVRVTAPDAVAAALTIRGHGLDALFVDDTAAAVARTATLSPTTVTGVAPATITYAGLATLDVSLGTVPDVVTVANTAAATTTTLHTGPAGDAIAVLATAGPTTIAAAATGANVITVAAGSLATIAGPLSFAGNGTDAVTLDATAAPATAAVLTATTVAAGNPATITYANLGPLTLNLGPSGNTVDVRDTGSPTTVNAGTGTNAIHVGHVTAPVTLNGSGHDALSADVATGTLTPTTLAVPNGTATYAGMATIAVRATTAFTVADTTTPTTVTTTAVAAAVAVQQAHAPVTLTTTAAPAAYTLTHVGSVAGLLAPITVRGSGTDTLLIDDTADTATATATVTPTTFAGLGTAGVTYAGLSSLTFAGTARTTLAVDDTAATTAQSLTVTGTAISGLSPATVNYRAVAAVTVATGPGDDSVTVDPTALTAPVSVDGGPGTNALHVDASADTTARTLTVTADHVTGFAAPIAYGRFATADLKLGSAADAVTITDPATPLTLDGGPGTDTLALTAAAFAGSVTATRFATATATTTADFAGTFATDGTLANLLVGGNLTGTVNAAAAVTTATVNGNLAGSITTAAALAKLQVNGNDTGTVSAAAIGTAVLPAARPATDGTVVSLTQAGVTRVVRASTATTDGNTNGGGAGPSLAIVYDGTPARPSATIVVANAAAARFDLSLEAPGSAAFDLARVDTSTGTAAVRNVTVDGNLLAAVTPAQAAALGLPTAAPGGVQLSGDALAAVAARGNIAAGSVAVASVQAIAFATVTDLAGRAWVASKYVPASALYAPFAVDPVTHRRTVRLVAPTEPLVMHAGTAPVAMYLGRGNNAVDGAAVGIVDLLTDGGTVAATVTIGPDARLHRPVIQRVAIVGNGASLVTRQVVNAIASTGPMGGIDLQAGPVERLYVLDVPSLFGTLHLHGGSRGFGHKRR